MRGRYRTVIGAIVLAVASLPLVLTAGRTDSAVVGAGSPAPHPRSGPFVVLLVVDGARYDEFDLGSMPNLARLVSMGTEYTQAWVGQLPSVTETSHATIGTGVFPARHGILGDTWRDPTSNRMTPDLLSSQLDRTGYIGKLIASNGVPSLAGAVHSAYPGSRVVALSGHKIYAAEGLGGGAADYVAFGVLDSRHHFVPAAIPGHVPAQRLLESSQLDMPKYPAPPGVEDGWTTTLAEKFLFKYHPRLLMVNYPEVDIVGHVVGTNDTVMEPLMSNVDKQIGRLVAAYGRAGLLPQTYWVITSDHGMVPAEHIVNIDTIKSVIVKAGGTPLYIGHGDYSTVWLQNPSAIPQVAQALSDAAIPHVAAVYMKNPSGHYVLVSPVSRLSYSDVTKTYADLLNTMDSPGSADIVLLYDENTITMTPLFARIHRSGDHEGATWGAQHIPLIMAGPGIRQAYVSQYPARLVDLAPTIELLMGITPHDQDGFPLADAMVHPPGWATSRQNSQSGRLTSEVTALEREAHGTGTRR